MTKFKLRLKPLSIISKTALLLFFCTVEAQLVSAKKKLPVVKASNKQGIIRDGKRPVSWGLDPKARPDIYYVDIPRRKNTITLETDQGKISFKTKYGEDYDFIVLLNGKDSCFTRISARAHPTTSDLSSSGLPPDTIPFTLKGSRVYFQGVLNGKEPVSIQFDTGAGTSCVSKQSSERLNLSFARKIVVSNSNGINETRRSMNNTLSIGKLQLARLSLAEVGNMQPGEDLIIGTSYFRDKIIEIDYDKLLFIVRDQLPEYAKSFTRQAMVYGLNIKSKIVQNGKKYDFWFGFDTGRDGTMLLREDFTEQPGVWENLKELAMLNGRKIVRLDATIAGVTFKDIVTNAADPNKPAARRAGSLFGNAILNHFNVILDYRKGYIYLKPNSRSDEPYSDFKSYESEMKKLKEGADSSGR